MHLQEESQEDSSMAPSSQTALIESFGEQTKLLSFRRGNNKKNLYASTAKLPFIQVVRHKKIIKPALPFMQKAKKIALPRKKSAPNLCWDEETADSEASCNMITISKTTDNYNTAMQLGVRKDS